MENPPPASSAAAPRCGERYRARTLIARGSRSSLWRGVDTRLGRTVALKVAAPGDPEAAERLHDEIAVHRACSHPTVATLLDADLASPSPYLVLGYAPGTLGDPDRALASATATRAILADMLDGLLQLEAVGLAHGRLRPDHVLAHWGGRFALCGLGDVEPATPSAIAASALEAGRIAFRALTGALPPAEATDARALLARERPDACAEDPILVGVVDALLHRDRELRVAPSAARELLLEPLPLLRP